MTPPIIDPPGIEAFDPGPNGVKMTLLKEDILLEPLKPPSLLSANAGFYGMQL